MQEYHTSISKNGRVVIPAIIRKQLHLEEGEELIIKVDDNGIHMFSLNTAIKRAQALVKQHNPNNTKLTDALFAMRAEEQDA